MSDQNNIGNQLGFDGMSEEERAELANEIGMAVLESASVRFLAEVDDVEGKRFESMLTADDSKGDVLEAVTQAFPRFAELLKEEATAFNNEAASVLS